MKILANCEQGLSAEQKAQARANIGAQGALTAGDNVSIVNDTISAVDTTYTAGPNIDIISGIISTEKTKVAAGSNISVTSSLDSQTRTLTYTISGSGSSQVNTDWNASSGVAELLNKPNLAYKYSSDTATTQLKGIQYGQNSNGDWHHQIIIGNGAMQSVGWGVPARPSASANLALTTDSNGKMQWTSKYDGAKRSHTAELYLYSTGDHGDPDYHVRNIQNYCVNHVAVENHNHDMCSVLIEAPTLATGEEYDYVVVFDCVDSSGSCNVSVENCDPEIEIKWEVDTAVSPIRTYAIDVTYTDVSWSGSPQYQIEVIGGRWQRHRF